MNRIKSVCYRVISTLTIVMLMFSNGITVNAADISKDTKIENIFEDMSIYYTQNMLNNSTQSRLQSITKQNNWDKELKKWGLGLSHLHKLCKSPIISQQHRCVMCVGTHLMRHIPIKTKNILCANYMQHP